MVNQTKGTVMNKKLGSWAFFWIFMSCMVLVVAQASTNVRYVYDTKGQLIGIIDENNNATAFTYDALGNLVSREHLMPRGAVDLFFVEPNRGRAAVPSLSQSGTPVTIHGIGFSAVPARNQVTFNGRQAVVDASTTTMIQTTVPAGATTGPVQVTSPMGTATSRSNFIVTNITVAVSPSRINAARAQLLQFTATVMEGDTIIGSNVVWDVNGIMGGNPTVGTISRNGLYRAPDAIPTPATVRVTATSVEEPVASATAMVTVVPGVGPVFTSASYRAAPLLGLLGPVFTSASYRAAPVALAIGPIFTPGPSYTTIAVTGLSPNQVARGATNISFTVTGRNFNGVTALNFLLPSGAIDANLTIASLTATPDGTQISARISVAGTAAPGARTVVVSTARGSSITVATSSNQLVIQ